MSKITNAQLLTPGGAPITGAPNAFAYFDPTGLIVVTDPLLTAAPVDQFGRPQIRDLRYLGPGLGVVWRQGAWQVDGDSSNVPGEGIVIYGAAANGLQDGSNGAFARVKPTRFGIRYIIGGTDIGYAWRVDDVHEFFTNDAGTMTAEIVRATGAARFASLRINGATGPIWTAGTGSPEGVLIGSPGDVFTQTDAAGAPVTWNKLTGAGTNTGWSASVTMHALAADYGMSFWGMSSIGAIPTGRFHGSNAGMQYSSDFANRAQFRMNQYGANTGAPGFTSFKSRGAFGTTASVIADDILGRWTTIGISADNTSLNLASLLSVYAQGAPTATKVPCREELELTNLAGTRQLVRRTTSEGETQALRGFRAGGPATLPTALASGALWSSGAGSPNGVIPGALGDQYSDQTNGSLWVNELGGVNGWVQQLSAGTYAFGATFSIFLPGCLAYSNGLASAGLPFGSIEAYATMERQKRVRFVTWASDSADATTELGVANNNAPWTEVFLCTGTAGVRPLPASCTFQPGEQLVCAFRNGTPPGRIRMIVT